MKFKKRLLSVMVLGLILPSLTVSASASSKTIPKKLRGTWVSKAQYNSKHHSKKTMWLPKLKLKVYKKSAKWQMKGTLPVDGGHYDHKVHTIKSTKYRYGMVTLKGKTMFTRQNFLAAYGKKIVFGTERGTSIFMTRAK